MVLIYDSDTSPVLMSEYQVVARAVAARDLASKVMVAQMRGDTDQNKIMVERFELKKLPFIVWLTKGEQDWQGRKLGRAQNLLEGVKFSLKLDDEFSLAQEEKAVIEMDAAHFRENAGKFTAHPVRGHSYALVLFFDDAQTERLLLEYDAVARTLAHLDLSSKVMVARLNVGTEQNKVMKERFDLKQLPFIAWLTKGNQDWWAMTMRTAEDLVAQIHERLNITLKPAREEL